MKAFLLREISSFRELGLLTKGRSIVGWTLSLMITAYVVVLLAVPLYQTSAPKGVVFATDNDGGRAIETSIATRWYNSNHFAPYGNLYYRLSHTLADLLPIPKTESHTPEETKERTHHFSLKLISLFCLFSLGYFCGWIFWGQAFVVPLYASVFVLVTSHMPLWSLWIFRPHPEHLLVLMVGIATLAFSKSLTLPNDKKWFVLSAMLWGLAMATKRSTAIFIPGILLVMLIPYSPGKFRQVARYIGYMLFAYLLIGFPQNFGFYKHIKFLLYESSLHSRGDFESISSNLGLIFGQLVYLLPLMLLPVFFSENREKFFSRKLLVFIGVCFLPLLSRKMSFVGDQHTMPLVIAIAITVLVAGLHYIPWRLKNYSHWLMAIVCLIIIKFNGISSAYLEEQANQLECTKHIHSINLILYHELSAEKRLLAEPFFPSSSRIKPYIKGLWGLTWRDIGPQVAFFGVTKQSITDYTLTAPDPSYYGKRLDNWKEKKSFYRTIKGVSSTTSPEGNTFTKIYQGCSFELWKKN